MKGAPWFKFYPSDFMAGVAELTSEERGSYISLLCHQWATGDLPGERMRMERLAGGPVSDAVAGKFVPAMTEGRVFNVRLESHREEAQRRSIAGSKAVERREEIRSIGKLSTDDRPMIDRSSSDASEARGQRLDVSTKVDTGCAAQSAPCQQHGGLDLEDARPAEGVDPFDTKQGKWFVPAGLANNYVKAYPTIDVAEQFDKARVWIVSNPSKIKTKRGMPRFLNGWMASALNDKRNVRAAQPERRAAPSDREERERAGEA